MRDDGLAAPITFVFIFMVVIVFGSLSAKNYEERRAECLAIGGEMIRNGKCYTQVKQ